MSREPYIEPQNIKDELLAQVSRSAWNEYATHCPQAEPVGSDGRNDWFRWECRDCNKKYISQRHEKRKRYYRCTECDSWHFIYGGFFDRSKESKPLREDEVSGDLCEV